jgi:hypothetical protein
MVDIGAIRQKIRADSETWNGLNVESPKTIEDVPGYPRHSEIEAGVREPARVIFDLRQALTRRGRKE